MDRLNKLLAAIEPLDRELEPQIIAHLNDLTKPPGSLGKLEEVALRYCLITGTVEPKLGRKEIFTFAGDHGVADDGVSAFPKEVTPQMVLNMVAGGAAVSVLSRHAGAELSVVDIGVDYDFGGMEGMLHKKVRRGTDSIFRGPAMSVEDALAAIEVGAELAREAKGRGATLLGTGEMGIANTTPSSALFAALLPCSVPDVTGRGTGIDDESLKHKQAVIAKALEINRERLTDPLNTLAAVGGLEIAGICGLVLGGASLRVPVVVDGFISTAGALVACRLNENVKDYLFFSHRSAEAGHRTFFDKFDASPILDLDMRLGEGTGAALAMQVVEASIKIYNEMATFSSAHVSDKS